MIKQLLRILFMVFISIAAHGQAMKNIFLQLPGACTPELNKEERKLLLQNAAYIIPGGDSIETARYTIDSISNDYLHAEYDFTTGQRGFNSYELKRFKTTKGPDMILFSTFGGTRASFFQNELRVFYLQNKKLVEDSHQKLLPQSVPVNDFIKKQTPDSVKKIIEQAMSTAYVFDTEKKNSIVFTLYTQYQVDKFEKWILGYTFLFTWTGEKFTRKLQLGELDW